MAALHTEIILRHDGAELARLSLPPGEYVIGRSHDVEISADTPLLSRRHARLTIEEENTLIEDLGSSNGTSVNGAPVTASVSIAPEQVIHLGDVELEIRRLPGPPAGVSDEETADEPPEEPAPVEEAAGPTPIRELLPEELLDGERYEIGQQVAAGGMGAILKARQQATQREVAMKVMLQHHADDDVLRFVEEAQVTAQLEHPNIVPIYELGIDAQDQLFYTMKLVRGITLKKVLDLIRDGAEETAKKYPLTALLTVFQKTCDALAFAHAKGIIHRDLKPENLMLGDFGEVLVMDWGLAKKVGTGEVGNAERGVRSAGLSAPSVALRSIKPELQNTGSKPRTLSGTIMGTPGYMSPEQARGEIETLDARSDVYALGAVLFDILHLRPPASGSSAGEIVDRVSRGEIDWGRTGKGTIRTFGKSTKSGKTVGEATPGGSRPLPHLPGGRIPDSLLAVLHKAMAFERVQRYQSVAELQRDLMAYQSGFATSAEQVNAWKQFRLFIRRNRAVSIAVTAALVVVAAVTTVFTLNVIREKNRAEATLGELRGTAPTFIAQATALTEAGKLDEALGKIAYATQLDPRNVEAHLQQANLLQINLRLHQAIEEYRTVLALQPGEARASQNLKLCEQLLADNGNRDELASGPLTKLVDSLLAQGRQIEANPLAQRVGKGTATTEAALRARLKDLTAQPAWSNGRLRPLPNGTFALSLNELHVGDLSALKGFPISDLGINDPSFHDVAQLAGLPLVRLGLSGTGVTDLSPLAGMPLEYLYLSGTHVADLSPLRTMKLKELLMFNLGLPDIQALAGMPLERLDIGGCRVTDLSPLRGMPLRELNMNSNRVTDFSPLSDLPLQHLDMFGLDMTVVPPITKCPLRYLTMNSNRISDFSPLAELKQLTNLQIANNPIGSIIPLRGLPLQTLDIGTDQRAIDLTPLADFSKLEDLALPRYFLHEEVLKSLPKLRRAKISSYQQYYLPMKQFWAELKPEWVNVGHARTIIQNAGLKPQNQSPVQLDPDGTLYIDLSRSPTGSLPSFAGLPVSRMNLDGLNVQDLSPLRGLRLRRLSMSSTGVTDLSPLSGMPLEAINLGGTKVRDLSILRTMPLQEISCGGVGISDFSFLKGKPIWRLDIPGNPVRDLSFIADMPVTNLTLASTSVVDLSPLRGRPLTFLSINNTQVQDLSPLRGMPLTELIFDQTPVQDVSVLADLPKLEKLRYSGSPDRWPLLRKLPNLKFIANGYGPYRLAEDFWAEFDAQQKK